MDKRLNQALHGCLDVLEIHPAQKYQMAIQIAKPHKKHRPRWLIVLFLLLLTASAYAAVRPAILDWLLGDAPTSQPLATSAQVLSGEATAEHVTARITGAVYDGSHLYLSYEVENQRPEEAILYSIESILLINGREVSLIHASAMAEQPHMIPSPHLDVLPVQRNPVAGGIWCSLPNELPPKPVHCEVRFTIYRPEKGFVLIDSPADETDPEIMDRLQLLWSLENLNIVQDSAEHWSELGYTVLDSTATPLLDNWHLTQSASITVPFTLDGSNFFSIDLSDISSLSLLDGTLHIRQFRLTALSTAIDLYITPTENSRSAAQQLAERYGALRLTDPYGIELPFCEMDYMSSPLPTMMQWNGEWAVHYFIDMPGLLTFPESIGLAFESGELYRFSLSPR